jgi:hypothetical protein
MPNALHIACTSPMLQSPPGLDRIASKRLRDRVIALKIPLPVSFSTQIVSLRLMGAWSSRMAKNEQTSKTVGKIASRGLRNPGSLSRKEVHRVSGAALTQRPDQPASRPPKSPPPRKGK